MKIILFAVWLGRGGAERQLVGLAEGLRAEGHEPVVVVLYGGGKLEQDLAASGIPLITINRRRRYEITGVVRLARTLRKQHADIVYSFLAVPNVLSAILWPWLRPAKIVWGVRASEIHWEEFHVKTRAAFATTRLLARVPDLIVVNSTAGVAYHAQRGYPTEKMVMIPNGIDTKRFYPDDEKGRAFKEKLGLPTDHRIVGLVGRVDPMKDHETFLRAAALLVSECNDVTCVCVGSTESPLWPRLRALHDDLGLGERLLWSGEQADMQAAYNTLDVLCSSSSAEGFSNVIAEAMSCGVPCVVTDVGDSAAIVGDAGIVVPRRDPVALAKALARMLDQLSSNPHEYASVNRNRIIDNYDRDRLVHRTTTVFLDLAHQS